LEYIRQQVKLKINCSDELERLISELLELRAQNSKLLDKSNDRKVIKAQYIRKIGYYFWRYDKNDDLDIVKVISLDYNKNRDFRVYAFNKNETSLYGEFIDPLSLSEISQYLKSIRPVWTKEMLHKVDEDSKMIFLKEKPE